ncbi:hypothetical protein [Streptomyces sp. NBC_00439]|uniref:hypothetical protein n=1 Tax=unclassified Streptomyces TaxID=2593676 RepID=UPI0022535999|nr:hypothetical protein [Streptomyces sp. NBC_00439]MCX5103698.1 hypothetical protein [Streptomyces sp. NBC_00439]WSX06175.1 hypothetical protein OG355_40280 [Streptomyces sp. NBC_00987]
MPWNWMQIRLHPPTASKAGYGEAAVGKGGLTYQEARDEVQAVLLTMAQLPVPTAAAYAEAAVQWSCGVPDDVLAAGLLVSRVYEYGRLPGETSDRAARVLMEEFSMHTTGEPHRVILSASSPGGHSKL